MSITLSELADRLGATFSGNGSLVISHVCGLSNLSAGGLGYLTAKQNIDHVPIPAMLANEIGRGLQGLDQQVAMIVHHDMQSPEHNLIYADDPLDLHVKAAQLLHPKTIKNRGAIHPTAVIGENVKLGNNVTIAPHVVIYDNVSIGDDTVLQAGVVVMEHCHIGSHGLIYPNVVIRENCHIGDRVVIHCNAVIGADGHGYYQRDGANKKLPQVGQVIIGDDVEIGSCTTIDRGRLESTIIGDGCKLDNQVQIGHNVELGPHALISGQSAIGGSTKIGHHLIMGGQSGVRDHIELGDYVTAVTRAAVVSKTPDKAVVAGMPSRPLKEWRMMQAQLNRLDDFYKRLRQLEKLMAAPAGLSNNQPNPRQSEV